MSVDVVVVTFNSESTIRACIDSVIGDPSTGSVVVVDNCSTDCSAELARERGATVISNPVNSGFGAGCNLGARGGSGEWILLLNPDAWMEPGSLSRMVDHARAEPGLGVLASEVLGPAGDRQPVRRRFPAWWRAFMEPGLAARLDEAHYRRRQRVAGRVDWASGSALLVRRAAFDDVGGFDEGFFLYAEDIDLCARMLARGHSTHWVSGCPSRHAPGSSTGHLPSAGKEEWARGFVRYLSLHDRRPALTRASLVAGMWARAAYWALRGDRAASSKWRATAKAVSAG